MKNLENELTYQNSKTNYMKIMSLTDTIKSRAYEYFSHRPDLDQFKTEINGITVVVNKDIVHEFVHFTAWYYLVADKKEELHF